MVRLSEAGNGEYVVVGLDWSDPVKAKIALKKGMRPGNSVRKTDEGYVADGCAVDLKDGDRLVEVVAKDEFNREWLGGR